MNQNDYLKTLAVHARNRKQKNSLCPVKVNCLDLSAGSNDLCSSCDFHGDPGCKFVFCLSGKIKCLTSFNDEIGEYRIPANKFGFFCWDGKCHSVYSSRGKSQVLLLTFPLATLFFLLDDRWMPSEIRHTGPGKNFNGMVRDITPAMNRIIFKAKESIHQNHGPDLLTLAKSMELLWLFLKEYSASHNRQICAEDRLAVQEASIILQKNLDRPPTLKELAKKVGMSPSKLKTIFPKALGLPPYEYLRKLRMEKAMALLTEKRMKVTDVAMEVGYSNISHFAKSFHKEFNINPSQVRSLTHRKMA